MTARSVRRGWPGDRAHAVPQGARRPVDRLCRSGRVSPWRLDNTCRRYLAAAHPPTPSCHGRDASLRETLRRVGEGLTATQPRHALWSVSPRPSAGAAERGASWRRSSSRKANARPVKGGRCVERYSCDKIRPARTTRARERELTFIGDLGKSPVWQLSYPNVSRSSLTIQ